MLLRSGGGMRTNYLIPGMLLVTLAAFAAEPRGVVLDRPIDDAARTLQAKLPTLSLDGMCEVEREGNGWDFQFRIKADKTTAEEVHVSVRAADGNKTELRVQGVHIEAAMITSKRSANPELTKEWTERIRGLIEAG